MKSVRFTPLTRFVRHFWVLGVGVLVIGVISVAMLSGQNVRVHEGGFSPAKQVAKQTIPLKDTTPAAAKPLVASSARNCAENGNGKLLLISLAQQHMWACDGTSLANESAITTGASALTNVDNATPTGTWRIYSKNRNTILKGCDVNGCWDDPVAYWMPFDDQIGFHDAAWQTFPFGSPLYTTQGSHGCVHLPLDFIAWVYAWAPVGTTVTVQA